MPRAGHGHHQASAILAAEAFDAAGDPKRFPEQLQYVQALAAQAPALEHRQLLREARRRHERLPQPRRRRLQPAAGPELRRNRGPQPLQPPQPGLRLGRHARRGAGVFPTGERGPGDEGYYSTAWTKPGTAVPGGAAIGQAD
ncbi:MAG: hypothetical protein WKG07_34030 [Hymenobacter sp.]